MPELICISYCEVCVKFLLNEMLDHRYHMELRMFRFSKAYSILCSLHSTYDRLFGSMLIASNYKGSS